MRSAAARDYNKFFHYLRISRKVLRTINWYVLTHTGFLSLIAEQYYYSRTIRVQNRSPPPSVRCVLSSEFSLLYFIPIIYWKWRVSGPCPTTEHVLQSCAIEIYLPRERARTAAAIQHLFRRTYFNPTGF